VLSLGTCCLIYNFGRVILLLETLLIEGLQPLNDPRLNMEEFKLFPLGVTTLSFLTTGFCVCVIRLDNLDF
jgi:hypothetical protein